MYSYSKGGAKKVNNFFHNITVARLTLEIVKLKEENDFKVNNILNLIFKKFKYFRKRRKTRPGDLVMPDPIG